MLMKSVIYLFFGSNLFLDLVDFGAYLRGVIVCCKLDEKRESRARRQLAYLSRKVTYFCGGHQREQ